MDALVNMEAVGAVDAMAKNKKTHRRTCAEASWRPRESVVTTACVIFYSILIKLITTLKS